MKAVDENGTFRRGGELLRQFMIVVTLAGMGFVMTPGPVHADDTTPTTTVAGPGEPPSAPGAPSEPAPELGEPDQATKPTAPGKSDTKAPNGSAPGDEPIPYTVSPEETYGACANQAPIISGQLLSRLSIAVPVDGEVTGLVVSAAGARVKEIEVPYYDWTTRRDGDKVTAKGPAARREGFWIWAAFDQITTGTSQVEIMVEAELADGTTVRHGGDGAKLSAFRVPVTPDVLANAPKVDPDGPVDSARDATETPLNGRTPCRIGEPTSVSSGSALLPLIVTGAGGLLLGAGGALLIRRRSRRS